MINMEDKLFKLQIVYETWGGTGREVDNCIIMGNDKVEKIRENFNRLKQAIEIYKKIDFRHPEKNTNIFIPDWIDFGTNIYGDKCKTIIGIQFQDDSGFYVSWEGASRFFTGSHYDVTLISANVIMGLSLEV